MKRKKLYHKKKSKKDEIELFLSLQKKINGIGVNRGANLYKWRIHWLQLKFEKCRRTRIQLFARVVTNYIMESSTSPI